MSCTSTCTRPSPLRTGRRPRHRSGRGDRGTAPSCRYRWWSGSRIPLDYDRPRWSAGSRPYGNFGILRAWPISVDGTAGLRQPPRWRCSMPATSEPTGGSHHLPHQRRSMHEVVFRTAPRRRRHTLDVISASSTTVITRQPSISAVVEGRSYRATETECVEVLDEFCDAMLASPGRHRRIRTCCTRRRSRPEPADSTRRQRKSAA
jgi:hypothetical protein